MFDGLKLKKLVKQLENENWKKREQAAAALGAIRDPQAVELLVKVVFSDKVAEVRIAAAKALAEARDPRAVDLLIEALANPDSQVRETAAELLGTVYNFLALGPLLNALDDGAAGVRRAAARALGKAKDPQAVAPLIKALGDKDTNVRRDAAWALGELNDRQAVEPLIIAFDNEVEYRHKMLLDMCGSIAPHTVAEIIQSQDKDIVTAIVKKAIYNVNLMNVLNVWELDYVNWQVIVVEAFGRIKDPRAEEKLRMVSDNVIYDKVRQAASTCLVSCQIRYFEI